MPKKKIILTAILLISLSGGIFFAYQWWQMKIELMNQVKQNENLSKELKEIKSKVKVREAPYCDQAKVVLPQESGFTVVLLTQKGDITLTSPDGSGKVGRWWDAQDKEYRTMEETTGMSCAVAHPGIDGTPLSVGCFAGMPRDIGDYLVEILPKPDTLSTDTYSLELWVGGAVKSVLANNVPFGNFPRHLYIIRSTETEIIPIGCPRPKTE